MRLETLRRLRCLACRGEWAYSFELQDGYYALGLREDVRDYFTINVRGTRWRFATLPMAWPSELTKRLQHLGLEIDLTAMRFYAPPDKFRQMAALARDILCRHCENGM
eukprot:jgi/Tetstr1/446861/TSEL_034339.t1